MSARAIRRALERQQKKLARKAERAAASLSPNPNLNTETGVLAIYPGATTQLDSEPRRAGSGGISPAQLAANRQNAQLSCGPRSSAGKETVSYNAFRHGLTGRFAIMPYESEQDYQELLDGLREEHRPSTPTEHLLLNRMAEHYWLSQRALYLQGICFNEFGGCDNDPHLALYLRYQTTHERAFHKCLNDLIKLKTEKRKEQNGFVSQQHKEADQARREAREKRLQERHRWAVLLHQAKVDRQNLLNRQLADGEHVVNGNIQSIAAERKAA